MRDTSCRSSDASVSHGSACFRWIFHADAEPDRRHRGHYSRAMSTVRVWVDANQPVVRVEGQQPRFPALPPLRWSHSGHCMSADSPLPEQGTAGILFDDNCRPAGVVLSQSVLRVGGELRESEFTGDGGANKGSDPAPHIGCVLAPADSRAPVPGASVREPSIDSFDCSVRILCNQPGSPQAWLAEAERPLNPIGPRTRLLAGVLEPQPHFRQPLREGKEFELDQCRFTQFPQGSKAYEGRKEIERRPQNVSDSASAMRSNGFARPPPAAARCRRRTTAPSSPWTCRRG